MHLKSKIKQNKTPLRAFANDCCMASAVAVMIAAGLMCAFAAIRASINMPFAVHQPVTTIVVAFSAFVAANIIGRQRQTNGLILGASVGGVLYVLVMTLSAFIVKEPVSPQMFIKLIAFLCAGGLGGAVGASKSNKPKKLKL